MTIAAKIKRCQGNLGALTHLFLENRLNLNSQEIFPHLEKAFNEKFESLDSDKERNSLLATYMAYIQLEGCHIFSRLLKENGEEVEEVESEAVETAA